MRARAFSAVALLALVAAACGNEIPVEEGQDGGTTTTVPGEVFPLTGMPAPSAEAIARPAMAVKISNAEEARPPRGLNQTDVVFEERVEAGITRLVAIFQSADAAPVGPIRSARNSDLDILAALDRPILVWGGANEGVAAAIGDANLVSFNVDPDRAENKFRDPERPAPDNLFIDSTQVFYEQAADASPSPALFSYRAEQERAGGTPSPGVHIDYGGLAVDFVWEPGRAGWARLQTDTPHVDDVGEVVAPENVVVLFTEYAAAAADPRSPQAQTVGSGEAIVMTGGNAIQARWERAAAGDSWTLTDAQTGEPVALTPGQTWVALPEPGGATLLDQPRADQLTGLLPAPPATPAPG